MGNKYGDIRYKWLAERGIDVMKDREQYSYAKALFASTDEIRGVFCEAPAGTGKTTVPALIGAYGVINGDFSKIIYIRNTEVVGKGLGFLPGDIGEKISPYMKPFAEALDLVQPGLYEKWVAEEKVFAITTTYERGVTYDNAFVIFDEAQSAPLEEHQTINTRPKDNCKIVSVGSLKQIDGNVKRIAGFTPFEIFMEHYRTQNASYHTLSKNYRGEWSRHADTVQDTINRLKEKQS